MLAKCFYNRVKCRRYTLSPSSHPHLLQAGEITTGILEQEYEVRRAKLIQSLPDKSISIITGLGLRYKSNNIFHRFNQNTDLTYFTGFNEPDSICVLEKDLTLHRMYRMTLYLQPKIPSIEMWDGPRYGLEGAISFFKADEAKQISTFPGWLSNKLMNYNQTLLFSNVSNLKEFNQTLINFNSTSLTTSLKRAYFESQFVSSKSCMAFQIQSLSKFIEPIRNVKSEAEIRLMQIAGDMSAKGFNDVLKFLEPGVTEHQVGAVIEYRIKMSGGSSFSYEPVVAGGRNALTLHYVVNQQVLNDGDLVLIDAGGDYGNYCSDITRTYPVNGKFSQAQRNVYEAVLEANIHCISLCSPSNHVSLDNLHKIASEMLKKRLEALFDRAIPFREWDILYPHFVGHYVGLDVHDCPSLSRGAVLVAGNVITIEPGIYIPDTEMYREYRGIGIRIEDDVVIESTPLILSSAAPKLVAEIEKLMSNVN